MDGALLSKTLNVLTQEAALWTIGSDGDARRSLEAGPRLNVIAQLGSEILPETLRGDAPGRVIAVDCRQMIELPVRWSRRRRTPFWPSHPIPPGPPLARLCAGRLF
jgi:hypothetical protein